MSADIQVQQLTKMIAQLDETLKMALNTTGADLKSIATVVSKGNDIADNEKKSTAMVVQQLTKEQKSNFETLKSEIIRTAEEVTQGYTKAVKESEEGVRTEFGEQYIAKSDIGEYTAEMQTAIEQSAKQVSLLSESIESVQNELHEYKKSNNAELSVQAEEIVAMVQESFVSQTELGDLEEKMVSQITQSATDVKETFSTTISATNENLENINKEFADFAQTIDVYIKRGLLVKGETAEDDIYGIEIGRSDSNVRARFTNEKLSFIQGDVEVAYVSGSNLYITRAEILDYLKVGNSEQGYFTFDVTEYGLEVRWNG